MLWAFMVNMSKGQVSNAKLVFLIKVGDSEKSLDTCPKMGKAQSFILFPYITPSFPDSGNGLALDAQVNGTHDYSQSHNLRMAVGATTNNENSTVSAQSQAVNHFSHIHEY